MTSSTHTHTHARARPLPYQPSEPQLSRLADLIPRSTIYARRHSCTHTPTFRLHRQAFPHNGQPGTYDASLFESSLAMGSRLSKQLGVKPPVCFSQRDETGMTRAILPLLNKAGVSMISLGSGGSSGGHPVIPDLFVWRDPASKAEVLFVHDHGWYTPTQQRSPLLHTCAATCANYGAGLVHSDPTAWSQRPLRRAHTLAQTHRRTDAHTHALVHPRPYPRPHPQLPLRYTPHTRHTLHL